MARPLLAALAVVAVVAASAAAAAAAALPAREAMVLLQTQEMAMTWIGERDCPRLCSQSCECAAVGIQNCANNCQQCLFDGVPCGTALAPPADAAPRFVQKPAPVAAAPAVAAAAPAAPKQEEKAPATATAPAPATANPRFQQIKAKAAQQSMAEIAQRMDAAIEAAVSGKAAVQESSSEESSEESSESSGAPPSLEARVAMIQQALLTLLNRVQDPTVAHKVSSALSSEASAPAAQPLASALAPVVPHPAVPASVPANGAAVEVMIRNLQELVAWVRRRKAFHGPDYGTDAHVNEVIEQALEIARSSA